jgi:hypothetical protein
VLGLSSEWFTEAAAASRLDVILRFVCDLGTIAVDIAPDPLVLAILTAYSWVTPEAYRAAARGAEPPLFPLREAGPDGDTTSECTLATLLVSLECDLELGLVSPLHLARRLWECGGGEEAAPCEELVTPLLVVLLTCEFLVYQKRLSP